MNCYERMTRAIVNVACILVLASIAGCGTWNPFGPGFDDGTAGWSKGMRPVNSNTSKMGLDGRSREIERNLGVR
ncbi:MAG: hypothetical protein O2931_09780 [Planctomycetota bacterium]|nr:hypothetical protein [Planctomycetota bacterium]MDA1179070.1 hypothetical protein [Planctomycetota bacterium]